ncbi:primase C-terminal domain-containing protein [Lysinibacillus irui]|uniref:primase C-terminal domain-containing protein n=1 Tax=Lysinibacillus irui TaxID=2998077 RepID=UPI002AD2F608|nr:primase C-terminal domain-containing protein [Lysinibacillus irui]MEA0564468.1 primase C-terminal domain-containing protein [Lysinibacillus irui]
MIKLIFIELQLEIGIVTGKSASEVKEILNRNIVATSLTGYLFRKYLDVELICGIVEMWNERNIPPLSQKELENIVISVAKLEAKRRNGK